MCYQIWFYSIFAPGFLFEKSLPSFCFVSLCELPRVNACICSPPPPHSNNQCFMGRLCLWTKLNFISLWSTRLLCVISAFETQCGFWYLVWGSLNLCVCPADAIKNAWLSAEYKLGWYYFHNHLQCCHSGVLTVYFLMLFKAGDMSSFSNSRLIIYFLG